MLGYAPVAALPLAALDFAAATVLPAFGPLYVEAARLSGAGAEAMTVTGTGAEAAFVSGAGAGAGRLFPG